MKCCNCEKEFENLIEVDGELWCEDCIESYGSIYCCIDCEKYHYVDRMVFIEDMYECICEDCARTGDYFKCSDCGNWYTNDNANSCHNGDFYVCNRCRDNYTYVECCDTYICNDNTYYSEEDDCYYCEEHYHNMYSRRKNEREIKNVI